MEPPFTGLAYNRLEKTRPGHGPCRNVFRSYKESICSHRVHPCRSTTIRKGSADPFVTAVPIGCLLALHRDQPGKPPGCDFSPVGPMSVHGSLVPGRTARSARGVVIHLPVSPSEVTRALCPIEYPPTSPGFLPPSSPSRRAGDLPTPPSP